MNDEINDDEIDEMDLIEQQQQMVSQQIIDEIIILIIIRRQIVTIQLKLHLQTHIETYESMLMINVL
jgi:hypothetical protein